jgi:hypothetical protein
MARAITVSTSHYDEATDVETDIEVECAVSRGSSAYFSRSFGNYLPGDPPEVEILSAKDEGGKDWTDAIEADAKWRAQVEERALEAASEPDDDPYDTREEARGER